MSLSFQKLNPVEVRDPRIIVDNERDYAVLKSGSQTSWKQYTTTSVAQSSIQFSCPPPSGGIIVDRKQYFYLPVRLTFTGIPLIGGQTLLRRGQDAPRAYPISSSLDTFQVSINNQSVSNNMADWVQALLHYNTDIKLKNLDYSMTPTCADQSQNYGDLINSIRNPLAGYENSLDETVMGRGGFPFVIVSNPPQNAVAPFITLTAIVDCAFCEPLFCSPFYWGHGQSSGFFNVNSMDFNLTFLGQAANRMWSHDASNGSVPFLTSSVVFGGASNGGPTSFGNTTGNQALMLFQYITPQETQVLSPNMSISYPYFDIQRYATDQPNIPIGTTGTLMTSNNIQLSSIPRRLYIFVRDKNNVLYSSASNTDTFMPITNLNIQFINKNGLLSSANQMQLYEMSVKNHCNMSWTQWSGGPVSTGTLSLPSTTIGTIGSVICVEFATDIGLDSLDAPGKLAQCMLQITVTTNNVSGRVMQPTLYLIPVLEGTFTIEGLGRASTNIGVITSKDILDAHSKPFVNYKDVECVNGGDFFSGLKDFGRKILSGLRESKGISNTLSMIPHPLAQLGAPIARFLGFGEGEEEGGCCEGRGYHEGHGNMEGNGAIAGDGVLLGGKRMSRTQLRNRLRS